MFSRCCNFETVRNFIEFKQIRLKSSNEFIKGKTKLSRENIRHHSEILCKILNCNVLTASEIVARNREVDFIHDNFYQNAKFCKKYLKLSDLVEFPSLLTLQPSLLQNRYFSLKELGFYNVKPIYIFRFPSILKKSPQELKGKGAPLTCEYRSNILSEYLQNCKRTDINDKLQTMYKDGSDFQKIKVAMNAEFLSAKLGCSIGVAHELLHKNAALKVQSILNTDHLLNILLHKCGFSITKILSCVTLLSMHHETVELFLSEFPDILGVDILFLVRRLPFLLKQERDNIRKVESILKDFTINKDQLICCPKVLSIVPSTLHKRLTDLCNTEEFAALKSSKKFLWLVYYHKNLNSRLKSLKGENMPCSINIITATKSTFEKCLLFSDTRRCIKETYAYLAQIFEMSEREILARLRHCKLIQSENQNFSAVNCQRVIEFLLQSGVTKTQIFNGLEIVYFDIDTVKLHFNELKNHPLCQPYEEWSLHYNFIQLLLYMIEISKYHIYSPESDELELDISSNVA